MQNDVTVWSEEREVGKTGLYSCRWRLGFPSLFHFKQVMGCEMNTQAFFFHASLFIQHMDARMNVYGLLLHLSACVRAILLINHI